MSTYTVSRCISELTGMLHGTNTDDVVNIYGIINRVAREIILDFDPMETKRYTELPPVFNQVYVYSSPIDLKGNGVIDIFPQVNRRPKDRYIQNYNQNFDIYKNESFIPAFSIIHNTGLKSMRINYPFTSESAVIDAASSLTANGTYSVGDAASDLKVDNINYANYNGSLSFNLSAGGTSGYIENSTLNSTDLTSQLNQGTVFAYVYLPKGADFTSIEMRWGSSIADYYSFTTTINQSNTVFQDGWNLLQFPWDSATVVGTPDVTKINFIRTTYNYNGNEQTAVRLNDISCKLGTILGMEYYSKFMFQDASTGAWKEYCTADSDIINLDTEAVNIFLYAVGLCASQQVGGQDAVSDVNFHDSKYVKMVNRYKELYKSEKQKPTENYYKFAKKNYLRFTGRRTSR